MSLSLSPTHNLPRDVMNRREVSDVKEAEERQHKRTTQGTEGRVREETRRDLKNPCSVACCQKCIHFLDPIRCHQRILGFENPPNSPPPLIPGSRGTGKTTGTTEPQNTQHLAERMGGNGIADCSSEPRCKGAKFHLLTKYPASVFSGI